MKQTNSLKNGFSLIEILMAIAILGGITVVLSQSFFAISRASTKSELVKDMKQSGDFSIRVIEQMIRSNAGMVSACVTTGTTSNQITIRNPDGYQTTFGCVWDPSLGISRLASISAAATSYLTPSNVTMGGTTASGGCASATMTLSFSCTSFESQPNSVKVSFTLSQSGVSPDRYERASIPFQTTINARN